MAEHGKMVESDQDMKYKVEDGARTLIAAEKIKQDPKLYALCQKEMQKQMSAISSAMGKRIRIVKKK